MNLAIRVPPTLDTCINRRLDAQNSEKFIGILGLRRVADIGSSSPYGVYGTYGESRSTRQPAIPSRKYLSRS